MAARHAPPAGDDRPRDGVGSLRARAFAAPLLVLAAVVLLLLAVAAAAGSRDFWLLHTYGARFLARENPYEAAVYLARGYYFAPHFPPTFLFVTALPALLPYPTAVWAWRVLSVGFHLGTLYLLADLALRRRVSPRAFAAVVAIGTIGPVVWVMGAHQTTLAVLCFAVLAVWLAERGAHLLAGVATGLCLMKPHLTVLAAALLLLRSPRRPRFVAGVVLVTALAAAPFIVGYRPPGDLTGMVRDARRERATLYFLGEQSLATLLHRHVRVHPTLDRDRFARIQHQAGYVMPEPFMARLNRWKLAGFLAGGALVLTLASRAVAAGTLVDGAAVALAGGLLTSVYSRPYDAVLLIPLWVGGVLALARRWPLAMLAACAVGVNVAIGFGLPFVPAAASPRLTTLAWTSVIYVLLSVGAHALTRRAGR